VSPGLVTLVAVLLGAGLGAAVVWVVLRRGQVGSASIGTTGARDGAEQGERATAGAEPEVGDSDVADAADSDVGPAAGGSAAERPVAVPVVPMLQPRPHRTDPSLVGTAPLLALAGLGAFATTPDGPSAPDGPPSGKLAASEAERLIAAVGEVAHGGVMVLPGPTSTVLSAALTELHARLGDVTVFGVPAPRRAERGRERLGREGRGSAPIEPFRALALDPSPLVHAGRCVVIVEDAQLHLRRGLDAGSLERLRGAAPQATVVLVVGACEHDASSLDDAGRWLEDLILPVGGDRIAAAGAHDPELDVPLLAAVEDAPLLADLAEAAAYACAAGRLPDVPLGVAARVAAIVAGGHPDEPAPDWRIGAALAADTAEPPLLHFGALDDRGLPTTVRACAGLVARCIADPGVLTADLLAVLLEEADDVERLLVARRLTASERPGLALPVLDALVEHHDVLLAAEARLVRGVARDRLGLATAADDYHAVGTGDHGTLTAHGAFLLGGILEMSDDLAPARAAYRSAIAAADPVHSPMAAFNLAWLEERAGDTDAALAGYRTVAEGEHRDAAPMAALNLATLLERAKRFAECESWYRAAIEAQHPDASPMAALSLGLMLERRQRPREALALFRRAAASGHAEAAPIALRRMGAPRR